MARTWKSECGCLFDITEEPSPISFCGRHSSYEDALAENNSNALFQSKISEELRKELGDVQYVLVEKRTKDGKEEIISKKEIHNYVPPEKSFEIVEKEDGSKQIEFVGYTEKEREILEKMKVSAGTIPVTKG